MKAMAVPLAALAAASFAARPSAAEPTVALHECAVIASDAERLACYDRLARRDAASPASQALPPRAAPVPVAPASAAPAAATSASTATAAPPAKQSFGLYPAEHPRPLPVAQSLAARVLQLGTTADGHMTVTLEGGQLWELHDADPLLAVGDIVTITRAAFGSFLMHTPTQRVHRADRLR